MVQVRIHQHQAEVGLVTPDRIQVCLAILGSLEFLQNPLQVFDQKQTLLGRQIPQDFPVQVIEDVQDKPTLSGMYRIHEGLI